MKRKRYTEVQRHSIFFLIPLILFAAGLLLSVSLSGCSEKKTGSAGKAGVISAKNSDNKSGRGKIEVVATTNIVADVVSNIGGDRINLSVLIPAGTSPHTFQPRPADVAKISSADVVFINGAGLEEFMGSVMKNIVSGVKVVSLSEGIKLRKSVMEKGEPDPHVWFSPVNVIYWVKKIEETLSGLDAANKNYYSEHAVSYIKKLVKLDKWVSAKLSGIPLRKRRLVTDHFFLGYFADRYNFKIVDVIYKSHSTAAEPSARDISKLIASMRKSRIPAVFIGKFSNMNIAREIARDTKAVLVPIYTGTLDPPGGEVDTYEKLIRYDVSKIAENLK